MGSLLNNPSSVPVSVSADWQPLLARDSAGNFGLNMITLTNWDAGTAAPQIAGGSKIDIMGSIASFPADEAIGGAPADGTVWLVFLVSGVSVTAQWTNTAPAWDSGKGQWSDGTRVYSGHTCTKTGAVYTLKHQTIKNGGEVYTTASGGSPIITKVLETTFKSGTLPPYPHGISNGTRKIVAVLINRFNGATWTAVYSYGHLWDDTNILFSVPPEDVGDPGKIIIIYTDFMVLA